MFVKPVAGRLIRDSATMRLLPPEGMEVPEDQFWLRRIRDKDIIVVETEHAASKPLTE